MYRDPLKASGKQRGQAMNSNDFKGRRSVITGLGVAAAGATLAATSARAQTARSSSGGFQPARHSQDAWMDEIPGSHRIFVDTSTAGGAADGLLYANNIYNAHVNAYSGEAADLAVIVCFRHFSTALGFSDAIWEKYGEGLEQTMAAARPANIDSFVSSVTANGAEIAICDNATQFFSRQLANAVDRPFNEIYDELRDNAIANSRFVAAGVMALTRAQEYGYSVLVAG
jgi:hypothetical protein